MQIDENLAQDIAEKIMYEVPYNVNIMNEKGIIIGSGEKERLGTHHNGAVRAIESKTMISLYKSTEEEKPGVNIPITFQNNIIGVVGLSGMPCHVATLASLVKVTVELLINQNYLYNKRQIKERMKENFLFQWAMHEEVYDDSFISQGLAVNIDITIPRFALAVIGSNSIGDKILESGEYVIQYNSNTHIYILKVGRQLDVISSKIANNESVFIGVGKEEFIIAKSIQQALRIIHITKKMKWEKSTVHYENHETIDHLLHSNLDVSGVVNEFKKIDKDDKGSELIKTLKYYIENNGNINAVADKLHVHRNSLNYRLDKIHSIIHLDPRNFLDLFSLYAGLIFYYFQN